MCLREFICVKRICIDSYVCTLTYMYIYMHIHVFVYVYMTEGYASDMGKTMLQRSCVTAIFSVFHEAHICSYMHGVHIHTTRTSSRFDDAGQEVYLSVDLI